MFLKTKPVSHFLWWIQERHAIHLRRQSGAKRPWTTSVVLQENFFTNPYRENDKTTVWFRETVRDPLRNDPAVLMATVIFRRFNYIPTGEILWRSGLLEDWDPGLCIKMLSGLDKVFTGAFMISSPNGKQKLPEICRMITAQWDSRYRILDAILKCNTLQGSWEALKSEHHKGLMPYEVVTDLRHTLLLKSATDIDTWAYFGPGGQRGMSRILGLTVDGADPTSLDQETCLTHAPELLRVTREALPHMPHFEMREIEHSLCEYDKFERVREGGRSKRKFDGTGVEYV